MIRYVLVAVLAVAILALGYTGVDRVASMNSQSQVEDNVNEIEAAASSLMEQESPPPEGHPPPQRTVTLDLPSDTLTTHSLSALEIERLQGEASRIYYVLDNGVQKQLLVDQPIVYGAPNTSDDTFHLDSARHVELVLTLEADDDGDPVVVVNTLSSVDTESARPGAGSDAPG